MSPTLLFIIPSRAKFVKVAAPATAATLTVPMSDPPIPLDIVAVTVSVIEVSVGSVDVQLPPPQVLN